MRNDSPFHRSADFQSAVSPISNRQILLSAQNADILNSSKAGSPGIQQIGILRYLSRREFLWRSGGGLGGIALAALLTQDDALAAETAAGNGPRPGLPHPPPKAKRVIQLFMAGAASHIDLF